MAGQASKDFGRRVRALREGRGLTQRQMASVLTIHHTNYAKLERGDRNVTLDEAAIISRMLDVQIDSLVGDTEAAEKLQQVREALLVALAQHSAVSKEHGQLVLQREAIDRRITEIEPELDRAYRHVKALEKQIHGPGEDVDDGQH